MNLKTIQIPALALTLGLAGYGIIGCGDKSDDTAAFAWPDSTPEVVGTYSDIVVASYEDSVTTATDLNTALAALVADPSESTMSAAKQAWLDSREPYLQTEVYRFYDGPIDNPDDGPEGLLNAWPLDEQYIDYVVGDDDAGIINGDDTIDAATLEGLNEVGGEKNVATGYHAVEFLLWGQDLSDTGPGERSYTDYVRDGSGTAANQDRRGTYLNVVGTMLIEHLSGVHAQWTDGASYRTDFESDTAAAIEKMLTGMIVLSGFETGGERLQAALDAGDQEEEHSCFSDNTHRDMIQDVQGVSNVWNGSYTRTDGTTVSGPSLKDLVNEVDADLAGRLDAQIEESLSLANALQTPFDQEISPGNEGNARVQALVIGLQAQEQILFEVFDLFGLSVEIPE
jgi:putative iron-regulated protein